MNNDGVLSMQYYDFDGEKNWETILTKIINAMKKQMHRYVYVVKYTYNQGTFYQESLITAKVLLPSSINMCIFIKKQYNVCKAKLPTYCVHRGRW